MLGRRCCSAERRHPLAGRTQQAGPQEERKCEGISELLAPVLAWARCSWRRCLGHRAALPRTSTFPILLGWVPCWGCAQVEGEALSDPDDEPGE